MKNTLATILAFLACGCAFGAWPFGNIGLNVDDPVAQLDIRGTNIVRGGSILIADGREDAQPIGDQISAMDRRFNDNVRNGIFIYSSPNDEVHGIAQSGNEDDTAVFYNMPPIFENPQWRSCVELRQPGRGISYLGARDPLKIGGCDSLSAEKSVDGLEGDDVFVYLYNQGGAAVSATLVLPLVTFGPGWGRANPCRLTFVVYGGSEGETINFVVKTGTSSKEAWGSVNGGTDSIYEFLLLPPGHGAETSYGSWQFVRGYAKEDCSPRTFTPASGMSCEYVPHN